MVLILFKNIFNTWYKYFRNPIKNPDKKNVQKRFPKTKPRNVFKNPNPETFSKIIYGKLIGLQKSWDTLVAPGSKIIFSQIIKNPRKMYNPTKYFHSKKTDINFNYM